MNTNVLSTKSTNHTKRMAVKVRNSVVCGRSMRFRRQSTGATETPVRADDEATVPLLPPCGGAGGAAHCGWLLRPPRGSPPCAWPQGPRTAGGASAHFGGPPPKASPGAGRSPSASGLSPGGALSQSIAGGRNQPQASLRGGPCDRAEGYIAGGTAASPFVWTGPISFRVVRVFRG
jgi:hypothetical protein